MLVQKMMIVLITIMMIREISLLKRDPEIEEVCKDESQEKSESINDDTETSDCTTCPVFTSKTSKYRTLSTLLISSKFERTKF